MRRIIAFIVIFLAFSACAGAENFAVNAENFCAVIDEAGKILFDCSEYDVIYPLKNENDLITGYAAGIHTQDKSILYAILSPTGSKITDHTYTYIEAAGSGFIASLRDKWFCLNSRGHVIGEGYSSLEYTGGAAYAVVGDPYDEIADDLVRLLPGGMVTPTGIEIQYGLGEFSDGLMPLVSAENLMSGYVDAEGAWAIQPVFGYASAFSGGRAIVACSGAFGVIDTSGLYVVDPDYSFISRSGDKFCCIKDDTAFIFDADGRIISETALNGASARFSGKNLILAGVNEVCVLDVSGALLFTSAPDASVEPAGDYFIVRTSDTAWIAGQDGLALSDEYDLLTHLEGDIFSCGMHDENGSAKYGLLRAADGAITNLEYDSIAFMREGLYAASADQSLFLLSEPGNAIPVR